ncbi:MAG TPA: hypothetical protein VGM39_12215 [Kofleriaceae bacterium]|jgi:hypothetical protein
MSRLVPTLALALVSTCALAGTALADDKVDCDFTEINATKADAGSIDADLAKFKKKLANPPFSSWNVFKLAHKESKSLTKKKADTVSLNLGKLTVTYVESVDKSKMRMTFALDVNNKNVVTNTVVMAAGDAIVLGHPVDGGGGHLVATVCK